MGMTHNLRSQPFLKNRFVKNLPKDKKLILTTLFITLFWASMYLIFFHHPIYTSQAKVLIRENAPQNYVTDLSTTGQLKPLTSAGNPVLTQVELLKSNQMRQALTRYVRIYYPDKAPGGKESDDETKLINTKSILKIKTLTGTDLIALKLSWDDPEEAQGLLEFIVNEFEHMNLNINKRIKTSRREYIDDRLEEVRNKLANIRDRIKQYQVGTQSVNLEEESRELVQLKSQLSLRLEEVLAKVGSLQSHIRGLENQLSLNSKQALQAVALGSGNENLMKLRQALSEAKQQQVFDAVKYAPTNPKMKALEEQIQTIKNQIRLEIEKTIGKSGNTATKIDPDSAIAIFDPVREKLADDLVTSQAKLMGSQAEAASLKTSLGRINTQLEKIPVSKYELDTLTQEENALSLAFDELRKKQIEARIKEAETASNVVLIDSPSLPTGASFPTRFHILVLSTLLGMILGVGLSLLKTQIEDRCIGSEAIEDITKSKVIGGIPWFKSMASRNKSQAIHDIAFKNILSNLIIACQKRNAKVVSFSSTALQKTSSHTLYALAKQLQSLGHSVVLVDADFRIPSIYRDASINGPSIKSKVKTQFSDLILSLESKLSQGQQLWDHDVHNTIVHDRQNLPLLLNTIPVPTPYELFGTSAFHSIIHTLRKKYDWVIIDTPSAAMAPEFLMIARASDGVILLADAQATYAQLHHISRSLDDSKIPLIGSIIREEDSNLERDYRKYLNHKDDIDHGYGDLDKEKAPAGKVLRGIHRSVGHR